MIPTWLYKSERAEELEQGDLLKLTDGLRELLKTYHPFYESHPENKFYAVLTQSCDLVPRDGVIGARYVSIAPVRPLRVVMQYEFASEFTRPDKGAPFGTTSLKAEIEKFLERILNNNEPGYFHYFAEPSIGLTEPMCAMLALPISFKAEHYDIFMLSRVGSVQSVFQAKLGWLLGQLYSRVGTPELHPNETKSLVGSLMETLGVWFPNEDLKYLKKLIAEFKEANPNQPVDEAVSADLIRKIPKRKAQLVDLILDIGARTGLYGTPSPQRRKFRIALEQDPEFARFF